MKKYIARIIYGVLNLIIGQNSYGDHIYGGAYDQSQWTLKTSLLECQLIHPIVGYGIAKFLGRSGLPDILELEIFQHRAEPGKRGQIDFLAPAWHPLLTPVTGWSFQFLHSDNIVQFSSEQAFRVLNALENGLMPTISHREVGVSGSNVIARISPVQFRSAYEQYQACQNALVPVTFQEVEHSTLYFESGSARLTAEHKRWLRYVAIYAREPDVRRVDLAGYSDSVGGYEDNRQLAKHRVDMMKAFFTENGVSADKLYISIYGELGPIASNKTAVGRAKNRRVTVRVYR
jgi:outer membrane protein OmpA-like peptidoglycan-associated protein